MVKFIFLSRRIFILLGIILAGLIIAGLYFWTGLSPRGLETPVTPQSISVPTKSSIQPTTSSLIPSSVVTSVSPISPISPIIATSKNTDALQKMVQEAVSLYNKREFEEALKTLDKVITLDANNFLAYNARGSIYTDLKDYEQAIADYSKVIELQSLFPHAYYNRGRAYNFQKKYNEALDDLQKSIQLAPTEFGYRAKGNIGLIYHQQGKYDQALEAFAAALDYDDSKADTYYFRGETYTAMGNYSAAIADYEAALTRFSRYDLAQQGLGYAYYKTKQFDRAMAALDKAAELTPNQPVTSFYRMLVYLATNQPDKAKTEAAQAVQDLDSLPADKQELLLPRILADLNTLAQENSKQAGVIEEIVKLIPQ